jgi:hypothetical protein
MKFVEAAAHLRISRVELLRTLLRLAGRSQLSIADLSDLLTAAGALENLRLDERTIGIVSLATGRRRAGYIKQVGAPFGNSEVLGSSALPSLKPAITWRSSR